MTAAAPAERPLVDTYGRMHTSLRISVTDRCNLRCTYCMPAGQVAFRPREELLTFEEIVRVVAVGAELGVRKLRITGGEPLMRAELPRLVAMLRGVAGIREIALTTNGLLLDQLARPLFRAGLDRLNISLDAATPEAFRSVTRRDGLDRVAAGIVAAHAAGFRRVRLNAVSLRGLTERQLVPLVEFASMYRLHLRFIEFMPLDADGSWTTGDVLSGDEVRGLLETEFGPLRPIERTDPSQPASDYIVGDDTRIGFIDSVSSPFCSSCNRLRLTAEGELRNCLFSDAGWDTRQLLRGGDQQQIAEFFRQCVWHKKAGHGIDQPQFHPPQRAMYEIGG